MLSTNLPRRTAFAPVTAALLLLPALALGAVDALQAQSSARVQGAGVEGLSRRIENIEPMSGPPGTVVTVASGAMPHITPVRIGLGALRTGFEALAELLTSVEGQFSVPVTVPDWARWDRTHRFIVFDFYFNPIALSDPFYVTNSQGLITRQGTVAREEGCVLLHTSEEDIFALSGASGDPSAGADVTVQGRIGARAGGCGEHLTLEVVALQVRPGTP